MLNQDTGSSTEMQSTGILVSLSVAPYIVLHDKERWEANRGPCLDRRPCGGIAFHAILPSTCSLRKLQQPTHHSEPRLWRERDPQTSRRLLSLSSLSARCLFNCSTRLLYHGSKDLRPATGSVCKERDSA